MRRIPQRLSFVKVKGRNFYTESAEYTEVMEKRERRLLAAGEAEEKSRSLARLGMTCLGFLGFGANQEWERR